MANSSEDSFPEHSSEMTVQQEKMDRDQSDMWEKREKMGTILTENIETWVGRELKQRRWFEWVLPLPRAKGWNEET